jgi:hypothetical protein
MNSRNAHSKIRTSIPPKKSLSVKATTERYRQRKRSILFKLKELSVLTGAKIYMEVERGRDLTIFNSKSKSGPYQQEELVSGDS